MLCLMAAALCIARLAVAPAARSDILLWCAAGVWFGLALLAKYHAILLAGGLVLFALTSREHRRWFAQPGPYVAALIALAIFSPVIIWNARNGWVSFDFQGSRAGGATLRPFGIIRSIGGQAGYLGPWVFVLLVSVYFQGLRRGPQAAAIWLLCCLATIPLLLFTVIALWAEINAHFHWQAPGYLMLFPLVGVFMPDDARVRRWLIGSVAAMTALLALWLSQSVFGWIRFPVPPALAPYVEKLEDPTLEAFDWPELRTALASRGLLEAPKLFVVATRWHQAGKMDVVVGDKLPVVCLCDDPRNIAFNFDPRKFAGWDALIIGTDAFLPKVDVYAPYFDSIEKVDDVDLHRMGRTVMTLHVYRARNYNGRYPMTLPQ
jgi:4-amino-4-deoxy-L-arabinose transferase-like glycosyltransferase